MEITRQSSGKDTIQIDRLSALPDDVVCHILSFLPTKLSVATNILSKRWRSIWAHVPNLEFVSVRHPYSGRLDIHNDSFSDIVNNAMLLYKVENMNTFRLLHEVANGSCTKFQLERWITAAIIRNVKKLDLFPTGLDILPSCIFTCKTLVELTLGYCGGNPVTGIVHLPSLKSLHLDSIHSEFDKTLPRLLSGCPLLEELIIIRRYNEPFEDYSIASPTIKRLVLKTNLYNFGNECKMKIIDTPALRYLKLDGVVPEDISEGTLASLIQVEIVLGKFKLLEEAHWIQFFDRAKCLTLSSNLRKIPESTFSDSAIKFGNLTKLELAIAWCPLTYFLENADKLEVLIISEPSLGWTDRHHQEPWMEPVEQWPACLYSLKTMTYGKFRCEERQFKIVRYLMENAKVLRRIEVQFCPSLTCLETKSDAVNRISMFELGSKACQLVFN